MKPTRRRAIKNTRAFRALVEANPAYGNIRVNLSTMIDYCEALMQPEGRIEYRGRK